MVSLIVIPMNSIFLVLTNMFPAIVTMGFGILIPAGLLLRCIPLLRNLGGTLIGMGIGIAIIFPLVLVLFNLPVTTYLVGAVTPPPNLLNTDPSTVCGGTATPCYIVAVALQKVGSCATLSSAFCIGLLGSFVGGIYPALNFFTYTLFDPILQFILILLDILIVFTMSNNIANLLGGSITLGIGRFKLA
jgi:hypothetical protein